MNPIISSGKSTQVDNGKAFEYAVALALSAELKIPIIENPEFANAKGSYERVLKHLQDRFPKAALLAVRHILEIESRNLDITRPKEISISGDALGQAGDVRDVIIKRTGSDIGISCKTNHDAFKHSRLSGKADFVKSWGLDLNGCSDEYWSTVRPVFSELTKIRKDSGAQARWSELTNVPERFYWPVLDAFEAEILRLTAPGAKDANTVSKNLISYIIGNRDFYKIISREDQVQIQSFNLNGTLSTSRTKFPEHVIGIDRLDGGQYSKTLRFNRGFTFNFRIHSASSRVESSLKFDIKAISLPPAEIYTNHIPYI